MRIAKHVCDAAVDVLKGFPPTTSAASLCWQCKKTRGPVLLKRNPGPPSFRHRTDQRPETFRPPASSEEPGVVELLVSSADRQWPKIIPARLSHSVIGPGMIPSATTAMAEVISASSVVQ